MSAMSDLDLSIQEYCLYLQSKWEERAARAKFTSVTRSYSSELGRKYAHIIQSDSNSRSSHSWVVIGDDKKFKIGDILKSASWKAPARNFERGNVISGDWKAIDCYGA
jgi:hypothetical protein